MFINHVCLNYITTAVMLSQPTPPEEATSYATILSNIDSMQGLIFPIFVEEKYSLTIVTHSYEVRQSQIPSHAITRKS